MRLFLWYGLIRLLVEALLSEKPNATHGSYSARLWVLELPDHPSFVLVFDQWEGQRLSEASTETIRQRTGARGVIVFDGTIELGC